MSYENDDPDMRAYRKRLFERDVKEEDDIQVLKKRVVELSMGKWDLQSELKKAKDFFKNLCSHRGSSTIVVPKGWLEDQDMLYTIIRYQGLPHALRCDVRIIQAAIDYYRGSKTIGMNVGWEYWPEEAKNNPQAVILALKEEYCCLRGWDSIPEPMQQNVDVAWKALSKGIVEQHQVPFLFETEENVLRGLNAECVKSWQSLPDKCATDIELVKKITNLHAIITYGIFQKFAELRSDVAFWGKVAKSKDIYDYEFTDTFSKFATESICSNADFITSVLAVRPDVLTQAHESLWSNPGFVKKVVEQNSHRFSYDFLCLLPQNIQHTYVDLIVQAISKVGANHYSWDSVKRIGHNIKQELWSNQKIITAWFSSSLPFIHRIHDHLANDVEVSLLVAKHCGWTNWFRKLGSVLKEDRTFLIQLLTQSPRRFVDFPPKLQKDPLFTLLFFGGANQYQVKRFMDDTVCKDDEQKSRIQELQREWTQELSVSDLLFKKGNFFTTLDDETTLAMKTKIAAFAGFHDKQLLGKAVSFLKSYFVVEPTTNSESS